MKNPLLLLLLLICCKPAFAIENKYTAEIQHVINVFQEGDKQAIASLVKYPLRREYPIAPINNKEEMLSRFDEVFDSSISNRIANSSTDDWSLMGWRGIMFERGSIWLDTDSTILSVNYQSQIEANHRKQLISNEKPTLHSSLQEYNEPVLTWLTENYLIRIDELERGKFRYASWKRGSLKSDKPDLVLTNGEINFSGSGGNHQYTFNNGKYQYICYVTVLGSSESPPGVLDVLKSGDQILREIVMEVVK